MTVRRFLVGNVFKVWTALLCSVVTLEGAELKQVSLHRNIPYRETARDGNADLRKLADQAKDYGARGYLQIVNNSNAPLELRNFSINGEDSAVWEKRFSLIWHRLEPQIVPAGGSSQMTLVFRQTPPQNLQINLQFTSGETLAGVLNEDAPLRIESVRFSGDLMKMIVYARRAGAAAAFPSVVYINGKEAHKVNWLNTNFTADFAVGEICFPAPVKRGEMLHIMLADGKRNILGGAALRAFNKLSIFGSYGFDRYQRLAENNLNGYNSFGDVGVERLDAAATLNIRAVVNPVEKNTNTNISGHPALYAYLLKDEPDMQDYSKFVDRKFADRIGGYAPELLKLYKNNFQRDSATPSLLTIDLTFVPFNYFIYSGLADITNPDIYTQSFSWSVKIIDNHLALVKDAAAPRPITFTFLSCWEEAANVNVPWISRQAVLDKGFEFYRSKTAVRGFGRAPAAEEIALATHYAIANGASGLFAYWDTTCVGANILYHGTEDLPEQWKAVGNNYLKFRLIIPVLDYGHPVEWAKSNQAKVKLSTLWAGPDVALVVAINEDYIDNSQGFKYTPVNVAYQFPKLPWLLPGAVMKVTPEGLKKQDAQSSSDGIAWKDQLQVCDLFLIGISDESLRMIMKPAENEIADQKKLIALRKAAARQEQEILNAENALLEDCAAYGRIVDGQPGAGVYNIKNKELPAIPDREYNGFEFYEESGNRTFQITWSFEVRSEEVNQPLYLRWTGRGTGAPILVQILAEGNKLVIEKNVTASEIKARLIIFTPEMAGKYQLKISQPVQKPIMHMGQIGQQIHMLSTLDSVQARLMKKCEAGGRTFDGQPGSGVYNIRNKELPAIPDKEYNGFEFYEERGNTAFQIVWPFEVLTEEIGKPFCLRWFGRFTGMPVQIQVMGKNEEILMDQSVNAAAFRARLVTFTPGKAGSYRLIISQPIQTPMMHMGQCSSRIHGLSAAASVDDKASVKQ